MDAPTNDSVEQQLADMRAHISALENELDRVRTGQSRHAMNPGQAEAGPEPEDSSSRRQLLRRGAVALGAGATAVALGTQPAAAANGDTVTVGGAFTGTSDTGITTSSLIGIRGQTSSSNNDAAGLFGYNTAVTNAGAGVLGISNSESGFGVKGIGGTGVYGRTSNPADGSAAIRALNNAASGANFGVVGDANAVSGIGVRGGGSIGVQGYSETGIGGLFYGTKAAVATIGKVGVGTVSPGAPVHVKTSGSPDATELLLLLDSTKPPQQLFQNSTTGAKWFFAMTSDDQFKISRDGTGKVEAKFFANGNLQIAGTLIQTSDVNVKTDIAPADTAAVLDAIAALDISTWAYKSDPSVTHLGPTAQGFAAAFGLGDTDTGIAAVDADGVALAAIQALNTKLETDNARLGREIANHAADNARLGREIAELRALIER